MYIVTKKHLTGHLAGITTTTKTNVEFKLNTIYKSCTDSGTYEVVNITII